MYRKLLLSVFLLVGFSAFSQPYTDQIAASGLPASEGQILDVVDYNNDGFDDVVYQSTATGQIKLYRNRKGVFSDVTSFATLPVITGSSRSGVISFDYNNDGFQDLLIAKSGATGYMRLFRNNCGVNFTEDLGAGMPALLNIVPNPNTLDPIILVSDYDKDNDNDLIFSRVIANVATVCVLKNDVITSGTFILDPALITGFALNILPYLSLIDYDNDNTDDLLVIKNSNINNTAEIVLYANLPSHVMTVVSPTGFVFSSPVGFATIWDYNHDSFPDILLGTKEVILPGSSNNGNKVFMNNADGTGTFTDVTPSVNTYSGSNLGDYYASHVFDADNDGDYDVLWEVNKTTATPSVPALMINTGNNTFFNAQPFLLSGVTSGTSSNARYTVFDYNNDGLQDIFKFGGTGLNAALYTRTSLNNYITFRLSSCNGPSDAKGSKVLVIAGGIEQIQSYSSQNSTTVSVNGSERLHFGLGSASIIDTIVVFWPNGGTTLLTGIPVNQDLNLRDGSCIIGDPMVFDFRINYPNDTANFCNQDTADLYAPSGFLSYLWSDGSSTSATRVWQNGWNFCTVSNLAGCVTSDSVYAVFGKGRIVQPDTLICLGANLKLDAYPRYDCGPFGAPAPANVTGQNIGVAYDYVGTYNGHYYYRMTAAMTWTNAAKAAQLAGGYLVTINDNLEQVFIKNNPKLTGVNYWTGLYRTAGNQPFKWSNCDPLTFVDWSPAAGAPSPNPLRNYVFMHSSTCPDAYQWENLEDDNSTNSDPCLKVMYGLVEFDASTNITYLWSTSETTPSITVSPTGTTPYNVTIVQNGATCIGNINVNIIDINNLLTDSSVLECKASFHLLSATPGLKSYLWTPGNNKTDFKFVFSNGWYKVTATSNEGCVGVDSIYVTIYNASIKTPDTSVCVTTPVLLRGPTPPGAFQAWYYEDFQLTPFGFWSTNNRVPFNSTWAIGPFCNDTISFSYSGLPDHDSVIVDFDLYIHDEWDGNCTPAGTDNFRFLNGFSTLLNTTFSNKSACTQNYPSNNSPFTSGATTAGLSNRCYSTGSSTLYHISKRFRHSNTTLDLSWLGNLKDPDVCNNSWSMDNVAIQLRTASAILWSTGDTTQNITVIPTPPSTDYWVRVPVGSDFCYDTVTVSTYTSVTDNLIFQDTLTICNSPFVNLSLPSGYFKYIWSNGDFSRTTPAYNWGWYLGYVETEFGGCTGMDSVFLNKGPYTMNQNDTSICYGTSITLSPNLHNNCNPFGAPANPGYVAYQTIPGYTYKGEYHGHYYYLSDTHSNWSTAAQSALAAGGHLACINDTLEQNFIAAVMDSNAWIGLFRNAMGFHQWMNCDTLTYTNWAPVEPSLSPEDYVYMVRYDCPDRKLWNSYLDDDTISIDPCFREIYGLLEIEPFFYKFTWSSGESTDSITVSPTTLTTYNLLVRRDQSNLTGGCNAGSVTVDIINSSFNIPLDSVQKVNCAGDTVMITAEPAGLKYEWHIGDPNLTPVFDTNQIVVIKDYVGYVYCIYDNGTCRFVDSVYINVPAAFKAVASKIDITCFGSNDGIGSANASGGVIPYSVLWGYNGSTNITEIGLFPGTYSFTVTDSNGCSAIDSVVITNPDSALSIEIQIIKGIGCSADSNAILYPNVLGGGRPYTGTWVGLGVTDTLYNCKAGNYSYTVTDSRGCTLTKDTTLTDPPFLSLSSSILYQIFCPLDSDGVVLLIPTGGTAPYNFIWNFNLLGSDTIKNVFRSNLMAYVFDVNFCVDSTLISMVASNPEKCDLMVPRGFSPNGDGKNDLFYVRGLEGFPENELTIFNRWGEIVFSKVDYANDWDGRITKSTMLSGNNGLLPNDTYYYILVTRANNKTYTGYLYLTR